jgi:anaerobic ribonucleoside-triphosphate reductase activating protein
MMLLNVADIRLHSRVNGPGVRSVVWVQGCTIGCPGCFNPHTHAHKRRHLLDPVRLAQYLAEIPGTDGLTISGGEPFQQAEACALLAENSQRRGRSVVVFTGYRLAFLKRCRLNSVRRLLRAVDLLIAGPYVRRLSADVSTWRGSINQTLHYLTARFAGRRPSHPVDQPVVEIEVDGRGLSTSGFPDLLDRDWLEEVVSRVGRSAP